MDKCKSTAKRELEQDKKIGAIATEIQEGFAIESENYNTLIDAFIEHYRGRNPDKLREAQGALIQFITAWMHFQATPMRNTFETLNKENLVKLLGSPDWLYTFITGVEMGRQMERPLHTTSQVRIAIKSKETKVRGESNSRKRAENFPYSLDDLKAYWLDRYAEHRKRTQADKETGRRFGCSQSTISRRRLEDNEWLTQIDGHGSIES